MLIGYRLRQRIANRIVDLAMYLFLLVTLFPIFWMVYCSFKGNNEILSGRVKPIRAENEIIFLSASRQLLTGSQDGGVALFDSTDGRLLKYYSAKSAATSFLEDKNNLWIASATKGFQRVDKKTLAVRKTPLPWEKLNISKIGATVLAGSADKIWLALTGENFQQVAEFDKKTFQFKKIIELSQLSDFQVLSMTYTPGILWLGTDKGLFKFDLNKQIILNRITFSEQLLSDSIQEIFPFAGYLWLATPTGLYQFNPVKLKAEKVYSTAEGLVSDIISSLGSSHNELLIGTSSGLSILNPKTRKITSFEKLFVQMDSEGRLSGNLSNLESANVSAVSSNNGKIYLGSVYGKISELNSASGHVEKFFVQKKGFVVIAWRNYVDLWQNIDFGRYLKNSLLICGATMLLAMVFATLAAYVLARFNFPGNRIFGIAILATQMIPAIMYLIPLYIMFVKFNEVTGVAIKGSYGGLIFIYTAFFTPFSIWILRGFFSSIPVELVEAARIDGCSNFAVFWRIALPLALPGIIATGIYIFLTAWDELMFAWVLTSASTMTIPVGIRLFVGNYQNRFDLMMAAATIATIPVVLLFFMLQRYIVKCLTAGAVKG